MQVVSATVRCAHCGWIAKMSGDTVPEVGGFLRALLLEHLADVHPDRNPTAILEVDHGFIK